MIKGVNCGASDCLGDVLIRSDKAITIHGVDGKSVVAYSCDECGAIHSGTGELIRNEEGSIRYLDEKQTENPTVKSPQKEVKSFPCCELDCLGIVFIDDPKKAVSVSIGGKSRTFLTCSKCGRLHRKTGEGFSSLGPPEKKAFFKGGKVVWKK
jgi:hypothetical protein